MIIVCKYYFSVRKGIKCCKPSVDPQLFVTVNILQVLHLFSSLKDLKQFLNNVFSAWHSKPEIMPLINLYTSLKVSNFSVFLPLMLSTLYLSVLPLCYALCSTCALLLKHLLYKLCTSLSSCLLFCSWGQARPDKLHFFPRVNLWRPAGNKEKMANNQSYT